MSSPSLVVVLAEDERHQRFVYRYLDRLGFPLRYIRFTELPSGRGCGEQWVRERYGEEVQAYRSRSVRAKTALIVAIDADTGDVTHRHHQFREALTQAGLDQRKNGEVIVHWIPKRSIETWILCLTDNVVDENTDYSRWNDIDEEIRTAAVTFFEWSRPKATPSKHCVPSLLAAIPEARRLD